jgi:DNA-binding PadR family transcriptional regulator
MPDKKYCIFMIFHFIGTLNLLEGEGFIKSKWEINKSGPAKKNYSITKEGIGELNSWVEFIKDRGKIFKIFLDRFQKLGK